jgi:hypothetical protein
MILHISLHKKVSLVCGLICILCFGAVWGQENAAVLKVRSLYNEVNTAISNCNAAPEEPCGYYVNTLTRNRQGQPWAAVGNYTGTSDFWYQGGSAEGENGPNYILRKINVETTRSARQESEEYLFDAAGKLIFYYFKLAGIEDEGAQEFRFYFERGKLIHYTEKLYAAEEPYRQYQKSDATKVLQQADKMVEWFQESL